MPTGTVGAVPIWLRRSPVCLLHIILQHVRASRAAYDGVAVLWVCPGIATQLGRSC